MDYYKEISNPTYLETITALSQSAYMMVMVETPECAAQGIGDAQYLHDYYNTLDEVAAARHEKVRKVPSGTYSSRILEGGGKSELPEDVLKARERRDDRANKAINAQIERWWNKRGLNIATEYPHRMIMTAAVHWLNGHRFLETPIAKEIGAADARAEESKVLPARGEPSANLISWISAYFLVTHKEIYLDLLREWRENPTNVDKTGCFNDAIVEYRPRIKSLLFELLNQFFDYHFSHLDEVTDDPYLYFDGTFSGFVENNLPESVFFPNITLDTYRRFFPDDWVSKNYNEENDE